MKCIGGPWDGKEMRLQQGQKHIDLPEIPPSTRFIPPTQEVIADRVRNTTYTVRQLKTKDGDIKFLAPSDWSDLRAILHQFRK